LSKKALRLHNKRVVAKVVVVSAKPSIKVFLTLVDIKEEGQKLEKGHTLRDYTYLCPLCWNIDLPYGLHIRKTGHYPSRGSSADS
jgi:hypothetical protein